MANSQNPAQQPQVVPVPVQAPAPVLLPDTGNSVSFDLSKLTPSALLKHKTASPLPSKDELVKEAAQAPATAFIMPPSEAVIEPNVTAVPPAPPIPSAPSMPMPASPSTFQTIPPAPDVIKPSTPTKLAQSPFPQLAKRSSGIPVPSQMANPAVPAIPLVKFGRQSNRTLIFGIVVAILLVLLGSGYLLARGGTRVPVFYSLITGLSTSGLEVNDLAIDYLAGRSAYQFTASIELKQPSQSNADGPPSLPSSSLEAGSVYSLKTEWDKAQYQETGTVFLGAGKLTVNDKDPVTLALQTGNLVDESGDWRIYLPDANTPELLGTNSGSVHQTLLYPVLATPSLEALLSSVQTVLAYTPELDQNRVTYSYSADTSKLSSMLPDQGELSAASVAVRYRTHQNAQTAGVPLAASFKATMKYAGVSYEYSLVYNLTNYDQTLAAGSDVNLSQLNQSLTVTNRTVVDLVKLLGILQISSLPNTIPEDERLETPTAILPTGQTVTSVGASVTGGPIPTKDVTFAAQDRDLQRQADLIDLQEALENYYLVNGSYPISISTQQVQTLAVLFTSLIPTYLVAMPVDPLSQIYYYSYLSDGKTFRLRSIAEDWQADGVNTGSAYPYYEITNSN